MPSLSIIPSRAVADTNLTDLQVRVLCAVGTFTNRLGGNVWASINTLAKQSNLSPRSVQRALPILIERGYLRKIERTGRTNMYEVILQDPTGGVTSGVTGGAEGGDYVDGGGVTTQSPKRSTEREKINDKAKDRHKDLLVIALMDDVYRVFPQRDMPHQYVPARKAVAELLASGEHPESLYRAALRYGEYVVRSGTEPKYVKSLHGFFMNDYWRSYATKTVNGRTREEWARSGQDVSEFDRLAGAA